MFSVWRFENLSKVWLINMLLPHVFFGDASQRSPNGSSSNQKNQNGKKANIFTTWNKIRELIILASLRAIEQRTEREQQQRSEMENECSFLCVQSLTHHHLHEFYELNWKIFVQWQPSLSIHIPKYTNNALLTSARLILQKMTPLLIVGSRRNAQGVEQQHWIKMKRKKNINEVNAHTSKWKLSCWIDNKIK